MSYLIPGSLSTSPGTRRTPHRGHPVTVQEDEGIANSGILAQLEGSQRQVPSHPTGAHPQTKDKVPSKVPRVLPVAPVDPLELLEHDEYGAELAKDARVWKVYIKEADQQDAELVDSWNKSLDVILVFAALFSAVSTAFLMESSPMLQRDPNDVSAAALVAISETLLILVNNSSVDSMNITQTKSNTSFDFTPSPHAVTINTLWYLSLSLSIATSLLAMLAKDWCYSFLGNRTGHPWDQVLRPQGRWMMIKKWKMQELIGVLPSLIHLSLLLFAVGLCIYVWELNSTTAIPVICVTGLAFAFYIWSSIMASIVKFFPYTTIISRALQSELMQLPYQYGKSGIAQALLWTFPVMIYAFLSPVLALILICAILCLPVFVLDILRLGLRPIKTIKEVYLKQGYYFKSLFLALTIVHQRTRDTIAYHRIHDIFSRTIMYLTSSQPQTSHESNQDEMTSLALKWIIQHCETPSSVAIALQAIAGASTKVHLEHLESCQATLRILQRLVSNTPNTENESETQLYSRALAVLGSHIKSRQAIQESRSVGDIEVAIWDLKLEHERRVLDLIKTTDFFPNKENIDALTTGNTATSLSLRLLKGDDQPASKAFISIIGLLSEHIESGGKRFYQAALLSLSNAAVLLAPCSAASLLRPTLVKQCMSQIAIRVSESNNGYPQVGDILDPQTVFLICLLLHGRSEPQVPSNQGLAINSRVKCAAHALTDKNLRNPAIRSIFYSIGLIEISFNPELYGIEASQPDHLRCLSYRESYSDAYLRSILPSLYTALESEVGHAGSNEGVNPNNVGLLTAITHVYQLARASTSQGCTADTLPTPLYFTLVCATCLAQSEAEIDMSENVWAGSAFPTLSDLLVPTMESILAYLWKIYQRQYAHLRRSNPTRLNKIAETKPTEEVKRELSPLLRSRHFAATQLWLSLYLTGGLPVPIDRRQENDGTENPSRGTSQRSFGARNKSLKPIELSLEEDIIEDYEEGIHLGVYSARVIECILHYRHEQRISISKPLLARIRNHLQNVPSRLRVSSLFPPSKITQSNHPPSNSEQGSPRASSITRAIETELPLSIASSGSRSSMQLELGMEPDEEVRPGSRIAGPGNESHVTIAMIANPGSSEPHNPTLL